MSLWLLWKAAFRMKRVLYSSPFIPPEFITAHGHRPSRVLSAAATDCHQGRCAVAAGFDEALEHGDLGIVVGSCDQMRRSADGRVAPTFRFHLPATWTTANAARQYGDELQRLSVFLQRHGGHAPADLAAHLLDHDTRRARLRAGCALLPARAAAEAIAAYAVSGVVPASDPVAQPPDGRVPIALLGGPLPAAAFALYDLIEASGARVVLDGCESGERGLAAPCDRRLAADDPLAALVDSYFLAIPDAFRRPDSLIFTWLERGIAERGVRAVVVRPDPWCDLWRAVVPRLQDWGRLPVVLAEGDGERGGHARLVTRLEALVEMLA